MKQIPLSQGKFALVDDEDYHFLMQWKWYYNNKYVVSSINYRKPNGKRGNSKMRMHQVLMNTPNGMITDHIDGDPLNNQRSNLRICTCAENVRNRKSRPNSTSRFKGVCRTKDLKKWQAHIMAHGKAFYLGLFTKEIDAARAYNEKAKELHGEFARLNEIPSD